MLPSRCSYRAGVDSWLNTFCLLKACHQPGEEANAGSSQRAWLVWEASGDRGRSGPREAGGGGGPGAAVQGRGAGLRLRGPRLKGPACCLWWVLTSEVPWTVGDSVDLSLAEVQGSLGTLAQPEEGWVGEWGHKVAGSVRAEVGGRVGEPPGTAHQGPGWDCRQQPPTLGPAGHT